MLVIFGLTHLEIIPTHMLGFVIIKEQNLIYLFIYLLCIYLSFFSIIYLLVGSDFAFVPLELAEMILLIGLGTISGSWGKS